MASKLARWWWWWMVVMVLCGCCMPVGCYCRLRVGEAEVMGVEQVPDRTMSFLGIRYASGGRFEVSKIEEPVGVVNATGMKAVCYQRDSRVDVAMMDEQCLYMNIWVPKFLYANLAGHQARLQLPVLVYIHGGAFVDGSGHPDAFFNPFTYTKRNVVVVSFNYRLGLLGFFPGVEGRIKSNLGLRDQEVAFQWIRRYIRFFGGSENKITAIGFDAGATSILHHLTRKKPSVIFQNSILISPLVARPNVDNRDQSPKKTLNSIAKRFRCAGDDEERIFDCLMHLSPRTFLPPVQRPRSSLFAYYSPENGFVAPVVDSEYPEILTSISLGQFDRNITFIIGNDENEGSIIAMTEFPLVKPSIDMIDSLLAQITSNHTKRILDAYKASNDPYESPYDLLVQLFGDINFNLFSDFLCAHLPLHTDRGVYRFVNHHAFSTLANSDLGAFHGASMALIFNAISSNHHYMPQKFTEDEEIVSNKLVNLVLEFIHGHPLSKNGWPKCSPRTSYTLNIGIYEDSNIFPVSVSAREKKLQIWSALYPPFGIAPLPTANPSKESLYNSFINSLFYLLVRYKNEINNITGALLLFLFALAINKVSNLIVHLVKRRRKRPH